ncbi:MAG: helix-hairpin-helix domain-containing protein [Acholeplasmataceae bacterium]|nr:helix-hairpin-helix domain-containing protein [Acholeplasmataceae bacterium]
MKQKIGMVIIITIVLWIVLFPRIEKAETIDIEAIPLTIIQVEIIGAVEFPGTYHFFKEVTVGEALLYAGNLLMDADTQLIMTSEMIKRNRQIFIPSIHQAIDEPKILVNVNKASFKELITIPGMTETRAASLIIYREAHGNFKHVDELMNVKNIGIVTLEKIKPYIKLG